MSIKLWGGRFQQPTEQIVEDFGSSVHYDRRLAHCDVRASQAHARMLAHQGVLSKKELAAIIQGLAEIDDEIQAQKFTWDPSLEDVHMNIEAALTKKIGDVGKKLHTARSRNDQVATDVRLYVRECIDTISTLLGELQNTVIKRAAEEVETVMPGHTHLQIAQPISLGYHLLAWNAMLQRDHERLHDCRKRVNISPLGAAALAGSPYPVDPKHSARALGFDAVFDNALDAVSDRDFVVEFSAVATLSMVHLSRIAEELILWNSEYFSFVHLPDRLCTGSSIMPQKKNPDIPELIRGKSGRVCGHLLGLLMMLKSQPLAYNRDNQEDKEALFDTADTYMACLQAMNAVVQALEFQRENMGAAVRGSYATATDLADYMVKKGVPFRDAHAMTGKIVAHAIKSNKALGELELREFQATCPAIEADVFDAISVQASLDTRAHPGGTAPQAVRTAVKNAKIKLKALDRSG